MAMVVLGPSDFSAAVDTLIRLLDLAVCGVSLKGYRPTKVFNLKVRFRSHSKFDGNIESISI